MTAAAIQAQLVDVRNLGTEKCIKLTLHVPAEQAMQVLECFGWATAVNPVPVALARLNSDVATSPREVADTETPEADAVTPPPARPVKASGGAKSWHEMAPAQQAGILTKEATFQGWLQNSYRFDLGDDVAAAAAIRDLCGVTSRSEIVRGTAAGKAWDRIVSDYRAWMREPEVVGS